MGLKTKGVLTFLLISFGLAWGAVFVAYSVLGMSLADPLTQLTMALPMAFSPAIAAVVVRRWVTREGFRDAGLAPRVWVPCLAHAGNNMIIGTLSSALLVDAGGLDASIVALLEVIPLAAICAWILLSGRLAAPGDAGEPEPVKDQYRRNHAV
jgi:hypothetical protein